MIRYRIQHAHAPREPGAPPFTRDDVGFDEFEVSAECLPRVGEHVEVDEVLYTVIAVFHGAAPATIIHPYPPLPIVRVKF